jgi:uncharacterized membrane protein
MDRHAAPLGVNKERVAMLSDGVFAIAATLLVLELKVPEAEGGVPLDQALLHVAPALGAYALSFFVIALFWTAYHRTLAMLHEIDRPILYLNVALLFLVSLQPFPTALFGRYSGEFLAVALYAAVMAATGAVLYLIWRRAMSRPELLRVDTKEASARAFALRLALTPAVFALSIPLAWWSPGAAIAAWVLVSLFTLASRMRYH